MNDGSLPVGLDVTQAIKKRGRGIARYIHEVAPRLTQAAHGLEPVFCVRGKRWWTRDRFAGIDMAKRRSWMPFSRLMSTRGIDLFHSFGNRLPACSPVPMTMTIHDFRSLDRPSGTARSAERLQRNIRRASGIICLTHHGRGRLEEYFPDLGSCHVAVIPHGVNHRIFYPRNPATLLNSLSQCGLDRPYVLQLGSWFPHKNPELTIRAFARTRARREQHDLVLLGGNAGTKRMAKLHALCESLGVTGQVRWIEDVPARELPLIVAGVSAVVMPSLYEGFGLPILEAMASGVPGVISDSSCLPEVCGGIWPEFSQGNAGAFADRLDTVIFDATTRRQTIRDGIEYARRFCWDITSANTARFFRETLDRFG